MNDPNPRTGFKPLGDAELARLTAGHCPQCNYRGFVIGPAGGQSINVECGNLECRNRYNVAFYAGEAMMGQNLFDGRMAAPWPSEPAT